jgi:hypothetical protein
MKISLGRIQCVVEEGIGDIPPTENPQGEEDGFYAHSPYSQILRHCPRISYCLVKLAWPSMTHQRPTIPNAA